VLFHGDERRHWVPPLVEEGARRVIVFMEYTEEPLEVVRRSWQWSRLLRDFERIVFH
jgi:hypothetical protein